MEDLVLSQTPCIAQVIRTPAQEDVSCMVQVIRTPAQEDVWCMVLLVGVKLEMCVCVCVCVSDIVDMCEMSPYEAVV